MTHIPDDGVSLIAKIFVLIVLVILNEELKRWILRMKNGRH